VPALCCVVHALYRRCLYALGADERVDADRRRRTSTIQTSLPGSTASLLLVTQQGILSRVVGAYMSGLGREKGKIRERGYADVPSRWGSNREPEGRGCGSSAIS